MKRRILGWLLVALQVLLFVVLVLLPWRSPTIVSLVAGTALLCAGVAVGVAAFVRLGSALTATPVPRDDVTLRTTGVYRWVRHPIYSALLLVTAAPLVAAGSSWSCLWGVAILLFFFGKSRWEDAMLRAAYGQQWLDWAATTGAFVPRARRRPSN